MAKLSNTGNSKWEAGNIQASSYLSSVVLGELEHPNKMPFSGILTYFDVPSDNPPNGSKGLKVLIPSEIGIQALDSLVGMAVNFVEGAMDGHNPTEKIGVITGYMVGETTDDGTPIYINGYIYAFDFEQAAIDIKLNQNQLGFSYETAQTLLIEGIFNGEKVAIVSSLGYFTGASILKRASAAYENTQLSASKEQEDNKEMDLKDVLDAISQLKEYIDAKFEAFAQLDELEDKLDDTLADAQDDAEEGEEDAELEASEDNKEDKPADEKSGDDEAELEASIDENSEAEQEAEIEVEVEEKEADLNASAEVNVLADAMAQIEALKIEVATLKASKDEVESKRKSTAYPVTLMAKYDIKPEDDYSKLMASIDAREDLTVEERLAAKFEARQKNLKGK